MKAHDQWKETMAGGTPEAERAEFEALARDIMLVQLKNKKTASAHGVPHAVDRAFHAKPTLATDQAELRFLEPPGDLRQGFAQPGRAYPAIVRFSNAAGTGQSDAAPDLRGVALRVQVSPDRLRPHRQDPHGGVDAGHPGHRGYASLATPVSMFTREMKNPRTMPGDTSWGFPSREPLLR